MKRRRRQRVSSPGAAGMTKVARADRVGTGTAGYRYTARAGDQKGDDAAQARQKSRPMKFPWRGRGFGHGDGSSQGLPPPFPSAAPRRCAHSCYREATESRKWRGRPAIGAGSSIDMGAGYPAWLHRGDRTRSRAGCRPARRPTTSSCPRLWRNRKACGRSARMRPDVALSVQPPQRRGRWCLRRPTLGAPPVAYLDGRLAASTPAVQRLVARRSRKAITRGVGTGVTARHNRRPAAPRRACDIRVLETAVLLPQHPHRSRHWLVLTAADAASGVPVSVTTGLVVPVPRPGGSWRRAARVSPPDRRADGTAARQVACCAPAQVTILAALAAGALRRRRRSSSGPRPGSAEQQRGVAPTRRPRPGRKGAFEGRHADANSRRAFRRARQGRPGRVLAGAPGRRRGLRN